MGVNVGVSVLGFGVQGSGCGVLSQALSHDPEPQGWGFGVWGVGVRVGVSGLRFGVQDLECGFQGCGFGVLGLPGATWDEGWGLGFEIWRSGFRVRVSGSMAQG